ncbi:ABC transporter permease subunit [Alteromonas sp. 5E99-2]|uniref:ABC transporter permease subunit n=1 Tax=Alteromonas sp. 5E99-2 TaxID=2817683 RepID=UPI001A98F32A|nr:ABC transporter permease subunit [Alteromonas sp. 5E99-2]MBO1255188.1 ABC transporter permease subunit [Alteromonas sp. 5E99-2]
MSRFSLYEEEFHPAPWRQTWHSFKEDHVSMIGFILFLTMVSLALLAPLLAPTSPSVQNTDALILPPSWDTAGSINFILGTDALGRDVLSRLMYASRVTFSSALTVVLISLLVGVTVGTLAGMLRGIRSSVLNHLLDALMAIPTLLIAIIIVGIFGVGLLNTIWAITLALIPQFIHVTRNYVSEQMDNDYIRASKLDGATPFQIFYYSLLPNLSEMLVVQGTLAMSIAIIDISALGFLNLGAQSPTPELGAMLAEGLDIAYITPWNIILPGLFIFLFVLAINIVGDGLRAALRARTSR